MIFEDKKTKSVLISFVMVLHGVPKKCLLPEARNVFLFGQLLDFFGTLAILVITCFIKPIMLLVTTKEFAVSYPIVWMLSLSTLLNV